MVGILVIRLSGFGVRLATLYQEVWITGAVIVWWCSSVLVSPA